MYFRRAQLNAGELSRFRLQGAALCCFPETTTLHQFETNLLHAVLSILSKNNTLYRHLRQSTR